MWQKNYEILTTYNIYVSNKLDIQYLDVSYVLFYWKVNLISLEIKT
jgi:hypothetical protein